jgi:hypothetical protein
VYVHVPYEFFERYPLAGVLLGIIGCALFGFFLFHMVEQERAFGPEPEVVRIAEAVPPAGNGDMDVGRWVRLEGPIEVHCQLKQQTRHEWTAALLFGDIDETLIPATDPDQQRLIILAYDGDIDCARASAPPITGLLTVYHRGMFRRLERRGMTLRPRSQVPAMRLELGGGPQKNHKEMALAGGLFLLPVGVIVFFWRKHQQRSSAEERYPGTIDQP